MLSFRSCRIGSARAYNSVLETTAVICVAVQMGHSTKTQTRLRNLPIGTCAPSSSNSLSTWQQTSPPPPLNSSMDESCGRCSSVLVSSSLDNLPTPSSESSCESTL